MRRIHLAPHWSAGTSFANTRGLGCQHRAPGRSYLGGDAGPTSSGLSFSMLIPKSGLDTPWWHVAQLSFGPSPKGPSRSAGNWLCNGVRKLVMELPTWGVSLKLVFVDMVGMLAAAFMSFTRMSARSRASRSSRAADSIRFCSA